MKQFGFVLLTLILFTIATAGEYEEAYRQRADSVITHYKNLDHNRSAHVAMAKLHTGEDISSALSIIDTLTIKPRGDMFWMYPIMALYLYGQDNMPESYQQKIRLAFRDYHPYRGDTENHWVMYYTTMYLASQSWPDQPGEMWFNGKSSDENFEDAKGWLEHWMTLTTTIGQGEFDSPHYMDFYLTPMCMLYQFAEDPVMKKRAEIMLDWLLADFFIDYFDGIYAGGNSRLYQRKVFKKRETALSHIATYFLGDRPMFDDEGERKRVRHNSLIFALSDYVMPEILYHIATDRSEPYVSKERKRSRYRIRYYEERMPLVTKVMYMTPQYALGSVQHGHTEQILQHTWNLNWKAEEPGEITTLFTLHPYYSARDMCSLFTALKQTVVADVVGSKVNYDKEEKWVGSSPYERLFQHKGTLIGLYDLSAHDVVYPHYDGFFPADLDERIEDPSGWIFARTNTIYIAFRPFKDYQWIREDPGWRLRSSAEANGFILQACRPEEVDSFQAFQQQITSRPVDLADFDSTLHVEYTTLDGDELTFAYDGDRTVNGTVIDPTDVELFESPYVNAETGSQLMTLTHGNQTLVLDWKNAEIRTE